MPHGVACCEPVPLYERTCRAPGCHEVFYLCKRCDRGQRYCSSHCRALARRLRHRIASARYQHTPLGRLGHADCQHAYRERIRARSNQKVTDPSSTFLDSRSSCGCDDARPLPHPHSTPRSQTRTPHPRNRIASCLRCLVCRRFGYVPQRDPYEPDLPKRQP